MVVIGLLYFCKKKIFKNYNLKFMFKLNEVNKKKNVLGLNANMCYLFFYYGLYDTFY